MLLKYAYALAQISSFASTNQPSNSLGFSNYILHAYNIIVLYMLPFMHADLGFVHTPCSTDYINWACIISHVEQADGQKCDTELYRLAYIL